MMMKDAQLSKYTKQHCNVHFKEVNFIVYKYISVVLLKKHYYRIGKKKNFHET